MKTIGQRIATLREQKKLNQTELATALGLSPQSVQAWESEKSVPRGKRLEMIATVLGTTPEYLLMGRGDAIVASQEDNIYRLNALEISTNLDSSEAIEIIRSIQYDKGEAYKIFGSLNSHLKIISIKGDSMRETLESGDLVFVDSSIKSFDGDGIYIFSFGRSLFIKRLQLLKDKLIVISDNKLYDKWEIADSERDLLCIQGKIMLSQSIKLFKHG